MVPIRMSLIRQTVQKFNQMVTTTMKTMLTTTIKIRQMHQIPTSTTTTIPTMTITTTHHPIPARVYQIHPNPTFRLRHLPLSLLLCQYPPLTLGLSLTIFPLSNA